MKEILPEIDRWKEDGEKVVVATVVATRRSAPRPLGASLAISESGKMCGSVSGGCVESDVFENAQDVLATGEPKLLSYGIEYDHSMSHEDCQMYWLRTGDTWTKVSVKGPWISPGG